MFYVNVPIKFKLACLVLALQAGFPSLASAVTYEQRFPVPTLLVVGSPSTSTTTGSTTGGSGSGSSGSTSSGTGSNSGSGTGSGTGGGSGSTSGTDSGSTTPPAPTPAPVVTLSTSTLNFGTLASGQTGSAAVVLTNTGNASLTFTSAPAVSGDSAFSSQTNCLTSLAPSASCSTTVSFLSAGASEHRGLLLFSTNATSSPNEVSLLGSSLLAQGVLNAASSPDFGSVPVGQTVTRTFTFSNPGNTAATGVVATLSGNAALALSANTCGTAGSPVSVAAGGSCSITVSWAPTAGGALSGASLSVGGAFSGSPTSIALSGTALQALGVLSAATSADFGTVPVGQSVSRNFTFSNPGNTSATGVAATLSGNSELSLSANTCGTAGSPVTVAAGGSCALTITWAPTSNGTLNASSVSVGGVFGSSPASANLTGTAAGAVATVSTTNLAFGDVNLGESSAKAVQLTNTGNDTLTFSVPPGLSGDAAYSAQTDCGTSLSAGQACTTNVTFAPLTAGAKAGSLRFQSNAYAGADQSVAITGNGKSLLSTLGLSPTTVSFGPVLKGGTAATATLTISNSGSAGTPLTIGAATAPFSKTGTTCGATLAAGASCTVSLSYAPTADGNYSTGYSLPLTWGAAQEAASVGLTGTVMDSAVSVPSLTFADTPVGVTTTAQTVTVSNPGTATVSVGTPTTAAPYAASYTCGASLAAGQNCLVSVTFTPTAASTQPGTLTIPTGAGDKTVTLTGKGLAAIGELSITPSNSAYFGGVSTGTTSTQTLTLKNTGTVTRSLTVGTPSAPFGMTTTCGTTLAANATCTVTASFTPPDGQNYTSGYSLPLTWGPLNEATSVALSGNGKDPYLASVTFLSSFDSLPFTELRSHAITNYSVALNTSTKEFGAGSAGLTGAGYLVATQASGSYDWFPSAANNNSTAYTMEAWVYATDWSTWEYTAAPYGTTMHIPRMASSSDGGTTNYWSFGPVAGGKVAFYYFNGSVAVTPITTTNTLTTGAWNHIAFVRSGTSMSIYVNGVLGASATMTGSPTSPYNMVIGRLGSGNLVGNIDEMRITQGIARYTGNFTPPTGAFPRQ